MVDWRRQRPYLQNLYIHDARVRCRVLRLIVTPSVLRALPFAVCRGACLKARALVGAAVASWDAVAGAGGATAGIAGGG